MGNWCDAIDVRSGSCAGIGCQRPKVCAMGGIRTFAGAGSGDNVASLSVIRVTTNSVWVVGLYRETGATRHADQVAPDNRGVSARISRGPGRTDL